MISFILPGMSPNFRIGTLRKLRPVTVSRTILLFLVSISAEQDEVLRAWTSNLRRLCDGLLVSGPRLNLPSDVLTCSAGQPILQCVQAGNP